MRKRAFVIGALLSAGIAMIDPYLMFKGIDIYFCWEYWAPAAIFTLFVLILLACLHRVFELKPSELLLIFIMTSTASVLPMALMATLISIIAAFRYFGTSVNLWEELIVSKVSPFLVVKDQAAINYFYEGLPPGVSIPYLAWMKPLGFFLIFILIFSFLSICLMVLFRKQWVEKERLIYPLTILPLEMIKREAGSRVPVLFRNKLFWLSFVIVFIFYLSNWWTRFLTGTPILPLKGYLDLYRDTGYLMLNVEFHILGLAYLIPRSISLSLWLFYLLFTMQNSLLIISGYRLPGVAEPYAEGSGVATFTSAGAMFMFVALLFWRAREHLGDCFRKAFSRHSRIDDSKELLSYRTSVLGVIIGFILMVGLMRFVGLPYHVSFLLVLFSIVVFLGLTRIVCQTGLPAARAMCIPPIYTVSILPPGLVTEQGYLALGFQYIWTSELRTSIMAVAGHTLKIQEEARISSRLLFTAIIASILISYVFSAWTYIFCGYNMGTLNASISGSGAGRWFLGDRMAFTVARFILQKIDTPMTQEVMLLRSLFMGIGAFLMGILMFLHARFLWWPIHYLGFPIAQTLPMRQYWFTIFLAWIIKGLILRFGGHNVYKKSVPVFLGMILSFISWKVVEAVLTVILK
ncbi:MAG TPA: hypothetical protein PKN36_10800 [bacterium]|nr:hypothetical protein [bacterium]